MGSNLPSIAGNPVETLHAAIKRLGECVEVMRVSSFYGTEPVGYAAQPRFVNAVVQLRTAMAAEDLMLSLLRIEREFGRDRTATFAKGPRTLDLDLLLMEDLVVATPLLTLPHPAMETRRFVLAPLAELDPGLEHPVLRETVSVLLSRLPADGENGVCSVHLLAGD